MDWLPRPRILNVTSAKPHYWRRSLEDKLKECQLRLPLGGSRPLTQ
jgi:hypothetical protein